jgi:hypothetical protein
MSTTLTLSRSRRGNKERITIAIIELFIVTISTAEITRRINILREDYTKRIYYKTISVSRIRLI